MAARCATGGRYGAAQGQQHTETQGSVVSATSTRRTAEANTETISQAKTSATEGTGNARAERVTKTERVAESLREQISSGQLPPAALLPSETQLVNQYGVSRITARAAIAALRTEGLVTVIQGKGAFVRRVADSTHNYPRAIERITGAGFRDLDTDSGWREVEAPATYHRNADASLALSIGIAEHSPLFGVDRLLEDAAGRRLLHRTYVPFATVEEVAGLDDDPFVPASQLYETLAGAGLELRWTEHVSARNPTPDDAATLRVPDGTPMLITRRLTATPSGRPLMMEETHRSAENTQLSYQLPPIVK